jgi:phosphoglycerate dehydrogenase-like enzyme
MRLFNQMKKEALFVNVGRGSAVDEPVLIEKLQAGAIAGAVLDVTAVEPLPKIMSYGICQTCF